MSGRPLQNLTEIIRHPLILSFYLPSLLFALAAGMLLPVLPLYAQSFGADYGTVGTFLAAAPLGMLIGDLPAGLLRRRLGNKRLMIVGILTIIVGILGVFAAQSILALILFYLLAGIGQAMFNVSRHILLADRVRLGNRGRAIAYFGGIARIGQAIGPVIGGTVATGFGQRAPFLLYVLLLCAALVLIMKFLKLTDEDRAAGHRESVKMSSMISENRHTLVNAGLGQLFAQLIRAGRTAIIPLYGNDVLGLDEAAIGLVMSVSSGFDTLLFIPAGWVMDNLGRKFAIVPSFVVQATAMLLLPLTSSFWGILAVGALVGLGNGISSGTMMTLGSDLAPLDSRGEFLGLWRLIGDAGAASGPFVVGRVAQVLLLQGSAVAIAGAGLAAALIFAFRVPETLKR